MGGVDQGDDLTFKVNFSGDGVAELRHKVKDKLKEFMGDYTDDTLVEYVIVLLKNGRRKVEARNELNVFLGDDSDSFVSWLWDHLGSNLDLYIQPQESLPNEVSKTKPMATAAGRRIGSHRLESEPERGKASKLLKTGHTSEQNTLVHNADEPPVLRSVVTANLNVAEDTNQKVDHTIRSSSPQPKSKAKRKRPDESSQQQEEASRATIGASRRLLQFAVRDAISTPRSSTLSREPSRKRLRSVVSTSTGDPLPVSSPKKIRPVPRLPNAAMAIAIKAAAEAAKDVSKDVPKVQSLGNVFDRLGRAIDEPEDPDHVAEFIEVPVKSVGGYRDFDHIPVGTQSTYLQRKNYRDHNARNITVLENDTGIDSDFVSNNEVHEAGHILGPRNLDVSRTGVSCGSDNNDLPRSQYGISGKTDESPHKSRNVQVQSFAANTSNKIVNKSVNVNTWKPPHYRERREGSKDVQKFAQESEERSDKADFSMKENSKSVSDSNGNAIPAVGGQKETQKTHSFTAGLYSTSRAAEDADSRTIFVTNVHFAATKDSLSRHFNKFGDVLKVVILTDAATGQPKGSAYVEFMRKEAAELALSLDGTSFMSRILKVARKSAAPQDAVPAMTWPRVSRGLAFAASRFAGVPFPRGIPGMYRSRLPTKAGRSFQWKRDAQTTPTEASTTVSNSVPSPITARSLTYVRAEAKVNGNSSTV